MTERLYERDSYLKETEATVTAVHEDGIELDRTVFYARGGGQPGDSGVLTRSDGTALVVADTVKDTDGRLRHLVADPDVPTALDVGEKVLASIDWDRRHYHMRMHTCLHLLCALIDAPVTGGNLNDQKGRLDFDLPEAGIDKETLTVELNNLIGADRETVLEWISDAELAAQPELVKTLSVKPPVGAGLVRLLSIPGIDLQPCGGTHVARTGEIGRVRISKIEKKSRLNRRISVVFDE